MVDEQVVQADATQPQAVPAEGTAVAGEVVTKEVTSTQPLTEERVKQLVTEAIEEGKTIGRRELQSQQGRNFAEVQRRARLAEDRAAKYQASLSELDPERGKDLELDEYRSKEQEEKQRHSFDEYTAQLKTSLSTHLAELEIDPADKRLDWAEDAPDFISGRSRFDASVAKILKVNAKAASENRAQESKDIETRLRKELGLDTVLPSNAAGRPGVLTPEMVSKMSFDEKFARRKEIANLQMG